MVGERERGMEREAEREGEREEKRQMEGGDNKRERESGGRWERKAGWSDRGEKIRSVERQRRRMKTLGEKEKCRGLSKT